MADLKIISTEEWGALPPRKTSKIPLPSKELWIHHTVGTYKGGNAGMRRLQRDHRARNFRTVGYSLVIDTNDPSYPIYEGAGIGVLGAHTKGHNSRSHGIALTGNFENKQMPNDLKARIAELVAYGHAQGWWPAELTGGHRDTKATACPGRNAYAAIDEINRLAAAPSKEVKDMAEEVDFGPYVEELYVDLLGRPSDEEGKAYWIDVLESGTDEGTVKYEFLVVRLAADRKALEALSAKIDQPGGGGASAAQVAEEAFRLFLDNLANLGKAE